MRKISEHMGMPISIDLPKVNSKKIFEEIFDICEAIDQQYSPYKTTSELSKFWRGQLKERDLSENMKTIMQDCKEYESKTDGYFSAYYAGRFNPTGYVKAYAIKQIADYLDSKDITTYMINAGGDIYAKSAPGHTWNIAINNPDNKVPLATLAVDTIAVATSGIYEKGSHIYDPHTKQPTEATLKSVTIFGKDIITADVFATAVFAMGNKAMTFMKKQKDYTAIILDANGTILTTAKT